MKSKVLLKWPRAQEDAPDDCLYSAYRLVGVELEPGVFEHEVEGRAQDALGTPSWRKIPGDELEFAISDLAWHLWKEDYAKVKVRISKVKKKKGD